MYIDRYIDMYIDTCKYSERLVAQKVFLKSFCRSPFPHESVKVFVILVISKDKLTDFGGS